MKQLIQWKVETRSLKELTENPQNPRKLTKDQAVQLEESISKFGLCEPIVINPDGMVIGGHQRLKTMKRMGFSEAEVYVPDRTLEGDEIAELTVRLNKNVGEWDFERLANSWDSEMLLESGFSPEELGIDIDLLPEKKKKKKPPKECPNCGHLLV